MKKIIALIFATAIFSFGNTLSAQSSVLASGNWYKIAIPKGGVYKLTYQDLQDLGMDVATVKPTDIRIYGNGGGMLPQSNAAPRPNDLLEIAVNIQAGGDQSFDPGDYVLFYADDAHQWTPGTDGKFHFETNIYSDTTYYFITTDLGPGKGWTVLTPPAASPDLIVRSYNDRIAHEKEDTNLIRSGKQWYGTHFYDPFTNRALHFGTPVIDLTDSVKLTVSAVARDTVASSFEVLYNKNPELKLRFDAIDNVYWKDVAKAASGQTSFMPVSGLNNIGLGFNFLGTKSGEMWLDKLELNFRSHLIYNANLAYLNYSQFTFRDLNSIAPGNIAEFKIAGCPDGLQVWDITDKHYVREITTSTSADTVIFKASVDSLREYIAFTPDKAFPPVLKGLVRNQDLHDAASGIGGSGPHYLIISPEFFKQEAERLANFHRTMSNLDVLVVTPQEIYNEYSSGAQDVTAIRDFVKGLRWQGLRYLLLFGDASYDYKNRIYGNTNLVPTFQSRNSLSPTDSYATDDYFGFLDNNEGAEENGFLENLIDIGIGRIPARTAQEAKDAVDKIVRYVNSPTLGAWRNNLVFVADDEDSALHSDDSEDIQDEIDTLHEYNLRKVYLDSYPELSTSGEIRNPQAWSALRENIDKGALILNYTGHGSTSGWAHERVLETADIDAWDNINHLPLFINATCDFGRMDDPTTFSGGKRLVLNSQGGGIGLITATRLVYAAPNKTINTYLIRKVFEENNGNYPTLGDIVQEAKVNSTLANPGTNNHQAFTLLGDPALKLRYPENQVQTIRVNTIDAATFTGAVKALEEVTLDGIITDPQGNMLNGGNGFTGTVNITVYAPIDTIKTLGQNTPKRQYLSREKVIHTGSVKVFSGKFSISFKLPADVGEGELKISYYAEDGNTDANGAYFVKVSGTTSDPGTDTEGPVMDIYIDELTFSDGDTVGSDPVLIAYIRDTSGVVVSGSSEIRIVIDGDTIAAGRFYSPDTLSYPMNGLCSGSHTVTVIANDIYGNRTEASIGFFINPVPSMICVWPGDGNNDGTADVWDVIPVGLGYNSNGNVRKNASLEWTGQSTGKWSNSFLSGLNYAYADGDGNGEVNKSDLVPILLNYGLKHNKNEGTHGTEGDPEIRFNIPKQKFDAGTPIDVPIEIGDATTQVDSLYGIAFSVNYTQSLLDGDQMILDLQNSIFGNPSDLLYVTKLFPESGEFHIGISRKDHKPVSGFGQVGTLHIVLIDNVDGKNENSEFKLSFGDLQGVDHMGQDISFFAIADSVSTSPSQLPEIFSDEEIRIYPNPARSNINIETGNWSIEEVMIFDLAGKLIQQTAANNSNQLQLDISALKAGMYLLRITGDGKMITERIGVTDYPDNSNY